MSLRIVITGGIASGKTTFAGLLQGLGAEILDADEIVHALEGPDGEAVPRLREAFGEGVMAPDRGIDRRKLARLVFSDDGARAQVNAILHPMVRERLERWLEESADSLKIAVIPLLFEVGWQADWDVIICVEAAESQQMERLMGRRGMSEAEARARLAAQMPMEFKRERSHYVISNTGSLESLRIMAEKLYRQLMERTNEHK